MAVIPIEMLKEHRYQENARSTRVLPKHWAGELDEEAAVVAIATGAARPRVPLTADQSLAVEIVKAAKAKDYARIERLRQENPTLLPGLPDASSQADGSGDGTPPAGSDASPAGSKRKQA